MKKEFEDGKKQIESIGGELLFIVKTGSNLYGTSTPKSDVDYRGVFIPNIYGILNLKPVEQINILDHEDYLVYSLKRFLDLIIQGDPQTTEMLFANKENVYGEKYSEYEILKEKLVSRNIRQRLLGFSYSEWRKAKAQKLIIEGRKKNEDDVIRSIGDIFRLDKSDMDTVVEILLKNKEKKLVPSKKKLGYKRKKEYEQFGYCTSSAAHSIRLLEQVYEILTTGNMTFPRANKDFVKSIKMGQENIDDLEKYYNDIREKVDSLKEEDIVLRNKPDREFANKFYLNQIKHKLIF